MGMADMEPGPLELAELMNGNISQLRLNRGIVKFLEGREVTMISNLFPRPRIESLLSNAGAFLGGNYTSYESDIEVALRREKIPWV
jgi:hypothetical protein